VLGLQVELVQVLELKLVQLLVLAQQLLLHHWIQR